MNLSAEPIRMITIKNVDLIRDGSDVEYLDLRVVKEGEHTSDSSSVIRVTRKIEVGHIFKLGQSSQKH
ncbi:MAG: hypothetical protein IPG99_14000 [Ignavibacteria bacterium]|nr:hypothetical protein [Ignavibacteria bacterium]